MPLVLDLTAERVAADTGAYLDFIAAHQGMAAGRW